MRAPGSVQVGGARPLSSSTSSSSSKGAAAPTAEEGSGTRKGAPKRVLNTTPLKGKKGKSKIENILPKRQRMRSPVPTSKKSSGEQNDVSQQKDEPPSGRSSSLSLPRVVSSSTPTKGSPLKKRSASAGRDSPSRQNKAKNTTKKAERGRTQRKSPDKTSVGVKSKQQRSPTRTPSEGGSPSPKRCRRAPASEQQSCPKGSLTTPSTETREQRIARSIESVINSFGSDLTSESTDTDTRNENVSTPKSQPKIPEVIKSGGEVTPTILGIKRCRGRPKGSKNKVKKEPGAKIKPKGKVVRGKKSKKCIVDEDTVESVPLPSPDIPKDSPSSNGNPKPKTLSPKSPNQPKTPIKKLKKSKKVIASKISKRKIALKPSGIKVSSKTAEGRIEESETSEVETDSKKSLKSVKAVGKSLKKTEDDISSLLNKKKVSGTPFKPKSGAKSVSFLKLQGLKKEILSDASDAEDKNLTKPLKKALKEKWSKEVKKSTTEDVESGKRGTVKGVSGRRRDYPPVCYEEESDHESDADEYVRKSPSKIKKEGKSPGRKRKRKKIDDDDDDDDDEDIDRPPVVVVPKRTARMASLNAIAMMACMNEDAKVPLPSLTQNEPPPSSSSMALVLRESTIARHHSGDESEDSEEEFSDRGSSSSRKLDKRKSAEGVKDVKSKRRRRRRGELDVTMDMKDMVVTKRMASLNASAIMAASYSTEARNRRPTPHIPSHTSSSTSRESEVTKISYKATKKQSLKTRSVITVQETTKKVKKAQTEGSTEVEEHIIVKKKVKHHRQSGVHVEEPPTPDSDHEILPKSPEEEEEEEEGADGDVDVDEARMIMESSTTITYVTTQTHTVPGTVTLSGVREYSVSTSSNGGKTTTMMQQVQRKSITTTCTAGPVAASTSSTIPTAHIPPNQHIQVAAHEPRGPPPNRMPQNYSPLGALEVMQPVMHHPPPPPPPPHSSHYMPYPHPHHGSPIPHPHIHHHPPPPPLPGVHPSPMHINPHHHHIPHHPSSPYPPLSPHSPPYPPPPPSTTSSSATSSPSSTTTTTCTSSPSTTPLPHPSPGSCHPPTPNTPNTPNYRSPSNCSPGFPSPVSSPKQGAPNFRDDRPPPPNGPAERHHSAFTAPTPSVHSPAAPGSSHGYQPVSGPIPTGGSSTVGSYKPPQGSPGNSASTGPPYSSPSRLTSPPPSSPASKPHYNSVDHYSPASSHPYQPYSYPPGSSSHYDKYYSRTPYHLYQPPYSGGQYPPPGEYGYQPPPSGTVHYSQESYTSYTLCVPAPPPHAPSSQLSVTHPSSALALPPPPATSNTPSSLIHHPSTPYTSYHCTEYTPMFPYPSPPGPSQNATCCPAGSPKNVPSGPLTGGGKGPDTSCSSSSSSSSSPTASDSNDTSKKQGPGNSACHNYHQYYSGSVPPQHKSQQVSNMAPTAPHPHFHHHQQQHSHHQSYSAKPKDIKDTPHQSSNENSPLTAGSTSENASVNHENNGKAQPEKRPFSKVPPLKVVGMINNSVTVTPASFKKDLGVKEGAKDVVPHSAYQKTVTSSSASTSAPVTVTVPALALPSVVPISSVKAAVTTSSVSTTFAAATTTTTSSQRLTSQTPTNSSLSVVSSLPSITTTTSVSSRGSLLAIATPLPVPTSTPLDSEEDKRKHTANPANDSPKEDIERIREVHATSSASASTSVNGGALIPIFPTISSLKTTTWVVQPSSASPTASSISSTSTATNHQHHHRLHQSSGKNLADTATHYSYSSPTNNTISVSLSNPVLSSTNSVMSTTAPVVATLEKISQVHGPRNQPSLPVVSIRQNFSDHSKGSERKDVHKEINNGSSALQRPGGRHHLLCQPLPLSHTKVTSVLAKVKPSNSLGIRSVAEDTAKSHYKSNTSEINAASLPKLPKNDKCVYLPRKRGRPPKNKDVDLLAVVGMEESMASSNGTPESKHFCLAPGEVSGRDMSNKRMSVLKSSGATISPPRRLELQQEQRIKKDMKEDMKINVKTEVPVGKIKSERVSPKQGFKEPKCKLLNGDSDIFSEIPGKILFKGAYIHPSLGIGNPDQQQELLKKKLKSETDFDDLLNRSEEKKIAKFGRPPKLFTGRIKSLGGGGHRIKVPVPKVRRKKASLLSYLKEKNESDTSIGEGETTPPPPPSVITAMDDDIQKQKEEEAKKSPVRSSSFPSYNALSIRGRRSSGAGKGNKVQRKPKYNHGWSWIGEPHEGKVWLRNDEIWIVRKCYNAMRHKEGDTVRVRDCVLLRSGPRKTDLPYVAKVAALWEDPETSDMMMSILWYYRPEHTESGRREEDLADEIFASKHRDHLSVACIEDRCYVLTFNEYCRYRRLLRIFQEKVCPQSSPVPDSEEGYQRKGRQPPGCVVHDLLFFCRKVYDYRQKRILKNPC